MNSSETLIAIVVGLIFYSFFHVASLRETYRNRIVPFIRRIHAPKSIEAITDEEFIGLHHQLSIFSFRYITTFVCAAVGFLCSLFYIPLALGNGNVGALLYIMLPAFAYVILTHNLNPTTINWIKAIENDLFTRIIRSNAEANNFENLSDYIESENQKMIEEFKEQYIQQIEKIEHAFTFEFEKIAIEEHGYDPNRRYDRNQEEIKELLKIIEKTTATMKQRTIQQSENTEKVSETSEK